MRTFTPGSIDRVCGGCGFGVYGHECPVAAQVSAPNRCRQPGHEKWCYDASCPGRAAAPPSDPAARDGYTDTNHHDPAAPPHADGTACPKAIGFCGHREHSDPATPLRAACSECGTSNVWVPGSDGEPGEWVPAPSDPAAHAECRAEIAALHAQFREVEARIACPDFRAHTSDPAAPRHTAGCLTSGVHDRCAPSGDAPSESKWVQGAGYADEQATAAQVAIPNHSVPLLQRPAAVAYRDGYSDGLAEAASLREAAHLIVRNYPNLYPGDISILRAALATPAPKEADRE